MIRPVNGSGMKRMALLNDLSCFGKCSLSVAMPILSSYGVETVPLPTAILSTHTADGFGSYVMRDMTDEMKAFAAHWRQLQIKFDGICMGFFGSVEQMHFAKDFLRDFAGEDTIVVVDPVLGDNGALYGCFTEEYVQAMRALMLTCTRYPGIKRVKILVDGEPYEMPTQDTPTFANIASEVENSFPEVMIIE